LTNNQHAIRIPTDLKGMKIRIPGVDFYTSIFQVLEAQPVKMNFGEVVNAIKKGDIQGRKTRLT